ncbi:adenylate/guanylate cyclase domain-containing protein [Acuticoccus sp. M5D2P5]|uniref:CHASE2 domain-containing protein n=1 Tax=Acuticoccus kalidii TaxID=2910977 RepID=UPI001F40066A|nr:adenylate/guanylate cyclase domain-containing protein [Acuticoccus kalidii]
MRLRPPLLIAIGGGIVALIWAALLGVPHLSVKQSPLDGLEEALVDLRFRLVGPAVPDPAVILVGIDDATLAEDGVGFPLPREVLADIVHRVADAGAKAVAVDILLLGADGAARPATEALPVDDAAPSADGALADALAERPAVIAAAAQFGEAGGAVPRATTTLWPAPIFADRAALGIVNVATAVSGTPRHLPLLTLTDRGPLTHLVVRAAAAFLGVEAELAPGLLRLGGREVPLDAGFYMPLRILGPRGTVPTVSARDVLAGTADAALAGKLVYIGFTATAVGDTFATPYDPVTPGVELLAGATSQILAGNGLARTPTWRTVDVAVSGGIGLLGAVAIGLLPLAWGLALAGVALFGWIAAAILLFGAGVWLSLALPIAVCVPLFAVIGLARYLHERDRARTARRTVVALSRFHSPALAARLADDPAYLETPETQRLAILFVDLASFTGLSETIGLDATQVMLKGFHSAVADVVGAKGGVVLNYLGDGALAVFGMPDPRPDDADRALAAAHALIVATRGLDAPAPGAPPLDARVGLHVDRVVLSRLGHREHQQLTVTGDGVNLAARLMEVAKGAGANIAASSAVMERLVYAPDPVPDRLMNVPIRGRKETIDVALWAVKRARAAEDAARPVVRAE